MSEVCCAADRQRKREGGMFACQQPVNITAGSHRYMGNREGGLRVCMQFAWLRGRFDTGAGHSTYIVCWATGKYV